MADKQLSGAAKRKLKKGRDLQRTLEENRLALNDPNAAPASAKDFADLGKPDLNDPQTGLEFTRRYLLLSLYQIGNDPSLPQRDRWRMIRETAQAIGMTHPRAAIEAGFKKLREVRERKEEPATTMVPIRGITRPATARRVSAGGGGSQVSGPVPTSQASDDSGDDPVGRGPVGPSG